MSERERACKKEEKREKGGKACKRRLAREEETT